MNSEPQGKIREVRCEDATYPQALLELVDRPPVLFIKGRWPLEPGCRIGIVGTRKASPYGMEVARQFTHTLVERGIVTVSGLASGIDTAAHRATLEKGGWTIAVLGHGFGYLFPKENAALFDEIAMKGTLVTEFPYDTPPQSSLFPQRNRIISGLSRGVLVIEAGRPSGALITARYAAEQGRDVFAVPGSVFSAVSHGCHYLIKEGAKLVETPDEILQEYFPSSPAVAGRGSMDAPPKPAGHDVQNLTPMEIKLLNLLSCVPVSIDELAEMSATSVDRLAETLLSLEFKGRVQALPGQRYVAYN